MAWWKQNKGKDVATVPESLKPLVKAGPDPLPPEDLRRKLLIHYLQAVCIDTKPQLATLASELTSIRQQRQDFENQIPSTFVYRDMDKPRESFVMLRGQYNKPGELVRPGVPTVLPPLKSDKPDRRPNRLDLARWLMSNEHPLTARVAVNRTWQQVFGTGLVKTSFDFGSQGDPPSHPELLDWLAIEFRDGHWDTKELIRLMVLSMTFRQSSEVSAELLKKDPENRLYARGPRFRLDAEQLRDNALFVAGLMDHRMGGRGVKPYQPPNIWEPVGFVGSNTAQYSQDHGSALYRRSLYTFFKRTAPPPFMVNFDGPSREAFCVRRERSNTPLQALQLWNDVQHFEAARRLAERVLTEASSSETARIHRAYLIVLSRPPGDDELAVVKEFLSGALTKFQQNPQAAKDLIGNGESPPRSDLPAAEIASFTLVANMLLNLDETITRN